MVLMDSSAKAFPTQFWIFGVSGLFCILPHHYIYFIDRYHTTEYNLTSIVVVATANLQLQAMADPIKTLGQLGQRCLPLLDKLFHGPCMFLLLPWLTCS